MPIDSNKPPDPLFDEFCELTKMTSAEEICNASFNDTKVKVVKGKHRKPFRGIKISTSGFTGAGMILRRLRSAKVSGKARDRVEGSSVDSGGGKRVSSSLLNNEINKVEANNVSNGNDGSFIKAPLNPSPCSDMENSHVAKSCGLKTSLDSTSMGDVGSIMCGLSSSKDGITIAQTGFLNENGMAGPSFMSNLASMDDVVSAGIGSHSPMDGISCDKDGDKFEFGKISGSKGILNKPNKPMFIVNFGSNVRTGCLFSSKPIGSPSLNAWASNEEEMALKMEYVPSAVSKLENGNRRIMFIVEEVIKGGQACSLQVYRYFVGTSMDYRVVRANLMRMWRVYDIEEITKTNSGIFYFKFKSEEGMKSVLESGPWMVQNIPLVLNIWEPGIWLEKAEPSTIPIWVCVHNIPMELCNGNGIGKIMSGVGKPMLMDKMTKDRCLKKARKLDFTRVLVEVSANDELLNVLEITYPPIGNREARVVKLEVRYQWKPPLCTHCKTFGHTSLACKLRPRTDEERAAKIVKDASNLKGPLEENCNAIGSDEDGFIQVGKNNKPILNPAKDGLSKNIKGGQSRSGQSSGFLRHSQKQDTNQGKSSFGYAGLTYVKKSVVQSTSISGTSKDNSNDGNKKGKQDLRQLSKDPNFKPKVLVRGSSLKINSSGDCNEPIPTMNSFLVLVDDFMVGDDSDINKDKSHVEDFESIWPDLKSEVDILMEAGIYPSKSVRLDWTVNQMDYFYKNCHKYHLDPSYEDEDVESECDGVAKSMRPEFEIDAATDMENDAAQVKNASNNASSNGGTRIIVGWAPNCINVMIMEQSAQVIHCFVKQLNGDSSLHCSFIYAHIHNVDRRSLWKSLRKYKRSLRDSPWIILGDFNTTLDPSKKFSGCSKVTTAMSNFRDCVAEIEVDDISMSGLNFTWNKSPGKVGGLLKKLDRVMGNVAFVTSFPTSYAHFLPFLTSDHTPAVLAIPEVAKGKLKPFKFHNYLTGKDGFIPTVKKVWDSKVKGFLMFSLVSKLKILKKPLRKLNFDQGNLFANVKRLRHELASIQAAMVSDPFSSDLREAELLCLKAFKEALKDEELFLRQKYKIEWLSEGDCNSKYFHNVVKGRINRGRIFVVEDMCGIPHFGSSVGDVVYMIRDISDNEIKAALFDIDNNKAPGPDGKLLKEVLNLIIKRNIAANPHFKYHWKCKDLKITHLCFADDLMLFCHGDSKYVSVLKNSLDEFGSVSGLFPSFPKSTMFIEGKLPVRHLGVPLLSKRLYVNDCFVLVDKVKKRILDWKNKSLSFAGRLQLILSVVGSMQVYWSSMFILPITISNEVERLIRDFLWNYGDFKRGKARIKWADVCKPKVEGGFEKEGLSWSWKKILSEFISKRKMYYSGLSLDCKVANVIENGVWKWRRGLSMESDCLNAIEPPCLTEGKKDKVFWKTVSGRHKDFSVNTVWNDLRVCSETEKNGDMRCVFFKNVLDSHDHLFFECEFSKKVWDSLKCMVRMDHALDCWSQIKEFMLKRPINKSIWSILQRLLIGASIYFIWQERNVRMFQDKSRSVEALTCLIKDTVRLRIMSVSLNDSTQVSEATSLWNFHVDRGMGMKKVQFHL
ncbi:putative reverse transcriptase domain-containing protein [Tanacetum coccineum]|uniref:Reverse transcriptase domain-containing protein n=1 Tax=Tanacetum coccineum TaxID=301880 RepID=A0ABQ4YFR7_9ASTR